MIVAAPSQLLPFRQEKPEEAAPTSRRIRVIIVDDQPVEREVMRRMLRNESDIEIVATCTNGKEALDSIKRFQPDLLFLDVQMPELDGFGVVSLLDPAHVPVIIFVTANEAFARRAFDVHALDYLLKPCTRERLRIALQRAREEIQHKRSGAVRQKLSDLLIKDLKTWARQPDRLAVRSGDRILVLTLSDIDWVEASDNAARVYSGKESHLLRDSLAAIESKLPPETFLRINRSTLVNIERIKELQPLPDGEYAVVLRNGTRLTLTRAYRDRLQRLGV